MTDSPDQAFSDPVSFIADRIAQRYGHPSRTAYLYLFQLIPGADFTMIPPRQPQIVTAWFDEGDRLQGADPTEVIIRCQVTSDQLRPIRDGGARPTPRNSDERRRLMARQVVFSITPPPPDMSADSPAVVELYSRAIAFTPKSDRRVTELWRPFEGGWFSAYKPPE